MGQLLGGGGLHYQRSAKNIACWAGKRHNAVLEQTLIMAKLRITLKMRS
jgi:hypothetical protein